MGIHLVDGTRPKRAGRRSKTISCLQSLWQAAGSASCSNGAPPRGACGQINFSGKKIGRHWKRPNLIRKPGIWTLEGESNVQFSHGGTSGPPGSAFVMTRKPTTDQTSDSSDRWEDEVGQVPDRKRNDQRALRAELERLGIKSVSTTIYEWGGFRYTNMADAIAAARRATQ